jgi:two-component system chemotaxis response regulator CheB
VSYGGGPRAEGAKRLIGVLVVDDSAVIREAFRAILAPWPEFVVATASDPLIAQKKVEMIRPDVIVLDVEMPRMDGLTYLRALMTDAAPIPVVLCSALAEAGSEVALRALEEGAVDVIGKPKLGVKSFVEQNARELAQLLRTAAAARVRTRRRAVRPSALEPSSVLRAVGTDRIVVAGASTGGTEAIREILEAMPADAPAIAVVQHMPAVFTAAFARRLDTTCHIRVKEAEAGDYLVPGRALIAPGDRHLVVHRSGAKYVVELRDDPPVSRHRPSVDVLFRSAARAAGPSAVGVILTGMGEDGAVGLCEMKSAGATTIAQDEKSCVVFGMPREAIERGAVDQVLPLGQIPAAILRTAS